MTIELTDIAGHFGQYGGRFVPEALIGALNELEEAHNSAQQDPLFSLNLPNFTRVIREDRASLPKRRVLLSMPVALG